MQEMTMVERVARALHGDLWQSFDSHCWVKGWSDSEIAEAKSTHRSVQASLLSARAAIEAMREPSLMMQSAALPYVMRQHQTRDVWRSMIDAALSE